MSGHNKWSSIKHRKAAQDAKRGAVFNKVIRELVVAAREGGADPSTNAALASAIERARAAAMPKDTMERAIARGAGNSDSETYERIPYEARGPAGTQFIVHTLTDNRNRTVADVRHIFAKHGGELTANGSVSWNFERRGLLVIAAAKLTDDALLEACAEAGADDFKLDGDIAEVYCRVEDLQGVRQWFSQSGKFQVQESDLAMVAKERVAVTDENAARRLFKLLDSLDENDDVQKVYSNWTMGDELMEKLVAE